MMMPRHLVSTATLAALGLGLIAPVASASEPAPTTVRGRLQDNVDAIHRTGTVSVVAQSTGPRGQRHATAGVADTATGRAAGVRDRFRIASTTKAFVATVILQLVGEGRMSLDDSVERWLPGVVSGNGNDGRDITVRQLVHYPVVNAMPRG